MAGTNTTGRGIATYSPPSSGAPTIQSGGSSKSSSKSNNMSGGTAGGSVALSEYRQEILPSGQLGPRQYPTGGGGYSSNAADLTPAQQAQEAAYREGKPPTPTPVTPSQKQVNAQRLQQQQAEASRKAAEQRRIAATSEPAQRREVSIPQARAEAEAAERYRIAGGLGLGALDLPEEYYQRVVNDPFREKRRQDIEKSTASGKLGDVKGKPRSNLYTEQFSQAEREGGSVSFLDTQLEFTGGSGGGVGVSMAPPPQDIVSRVPVKDLVAAYERQGFTVIGKSTQAGPELAISRKGAPSFAQADASYLGRYFSSYERRAEEFQKGFESLPVVSSGVGFNEELISRIQTFKGGQTSAEGRFIGDVALAPPMLAKFVYKLPETGAKTFGGGTRGFFGALEGFRTGDYSELRGQARSTAVSLGSAFTDPSTLTQLGVQSILIPGGASLFRRGAPTYRMTNVVAIAEDVKSGTYGIIRPGAIARAQGSASTDLVRQSSRVTRTAAPRAGTEVISSETYRGSVYGNIVASQELSPIEKAFAQVSNVRRSFSSGGKIGPVLERIESPYGTFSGRFVSVQTSKPVLETSRTFGTIPATGITQVRGTLKLPTGSSTFALRELSLERVAIPANPVEVAGGFRLLPGGTRLSGPVGNALERISRRQAQQFGFSPQVPRPIKYTTSLAEGTIGKRRVMSSGISSELFSFQTRAGEATLSAGETFNLARRGRRFAESKPVPAYGISLNRIGQKALGYDDLGRLLRGDEIKFAEKPGLGFARYARGRGAAPRAISTRVFRQLQARPAPKLLSAARTLTPRSSKFIDFGSGNFAQIVSRGGTVTIQRTIPKSSTKSEGVFVQTRGGMVQLQRVKTATKLRERMATRTRRATPQSMLTNQRFATATRQRKATAILPSILQATRQREGLRIREFLGVRLKQDVGQSTRQREGIPELTRLRVITGQPQLTRTRIIPRVTTPTRLRFGLTPPANIFKVPPPRPPQTPLGLRFSLRGFERRGRREGKLGRQSFAYQPSLSASLYGITARVPKGVLKSQQALGGFEFRPIPGNRGSFSSGGVRLLKAFATRPKRLNSVRLMRF